MRGEQDFEAGCAISIALSIIPMSWQFYWLLATILLGLSLRLVWLTLRPAWERWAASAAVTLVLALLLLPEMILRMGAGS